MARLFKDGAGTTYDSAIAKFISVPFGYTAAPTTANPSGTTNPAYEPFDYVTTDAFKQKVDNSAVANAFDCGECHVGGATMDYLPGSRVPLRQIETSADVPGGALAGKVTAFNYFIDQYDIDDDGVKFEALHIDYNKTGTVEMDCFMCHLNGYQYDNRKAAVRKARFDATRPVGAGIAAARTDITWGNPGYGTAVVYDAAKVVPVDANDPELGYKLASSVVANMMSTPPTANCSSCHFDVHAVDWKKRGDSLDGDVHAGIGCMGCHERKDKSAATVGTSGDFNTGADKALLSLCDPAKGNASPFEALSNQLDQQNFKDCDGCHSAGAKTYATFGAPDPAVAHNAKGLTNHLTFISCEACHVKKSSYVTGGSFVDGTGVDHEGRVSDHEHNNPVSLGGQSNRVAMAWSNDSKLHPVSLHTSFFIRSKNDRAYDMNADGRTGGVDGILQTHMAEVTGWTPANALLHDGVVTSGEIGSLFTAIQSRFGDTATAGNNLNGLVAPGGSGYSGIYPKLSFMTVPFKNAHNTAAASQAWGAGGCSDCHGAGKGFYNGLYDFNAGYSIGWDKATQMTPMTKVNGFSQATYAHPNVKDQFTGRSIAVDPVSATGFKTNIDRSEFLYEADFKTLNGWQSEMVGGAITFPAAPASFGGSLLKIVVNNAQTRTFSASTNPADVAALITHFGTFANAFEFDITGPNANGGITITAKPGYQIKLAGNADGDSYGLLASQYVAKQRTPAYAAVFATADVGGDGVATTRTEWVNYLNAIGSAVAPQANILHVSAAAYTTGDLEAGTSATAVTVTQGATINLVADQPAALGTPAYSWTCSDGGAAIADGATTTRVFNKTGTYLLTLSVKVGSSTTTDTIYVKVVAPASTAAVTWTADDVTPTVFDGNLGVTGLPTHTKITVSWSDYTATTTNLGTGDHTVAHTFVALSSRLVDTDSDGVKDTYRYPVTVRAYNNTTLVKTITVNVDIAKP